jgi:acyl-CoA thioesterase-2
MATLTDVLSLVPVDENNFVSHWPALFPERGRLFGGGLLALSTRAGVLTVDNGQQPNALKTFFLSPGTAEAPLDIQVERTYDGSSFSARTVTVRQAGKVRVSTTMSFHKAESGFDAGLAMPEVPRPDDDFRHNPVLEGSEITHGFEVREVDVRPMPHDAWVRPNDTGRLLWVRLTEAMTIDAGLPFCVLAYISDFGATIGARTIFGATIKTPGHFGSLNHSLWWHRPFEPTEWLLIDYRPLTGAGSRGLVHAAIHTAAGVHVGTLQQEALMRIAP